MASAWRDAGAAVGVLIGLVALVAVPAVVDAALPDHGPPVSAEKIELGYGVSLRPPPGARHDLAVSRPRTGEVALLVGEVTLKVTAVEVPERPADFVAHARRKLHRDEGLLAAAPEPVRTAAGVAGQRADLRSDDPDEARGCVGIFTAESAGAVAVISPAADCRAVAPSVWTAVLSLTFEPVEQL